MDPWVSDALVAARVARLGTVGVDGAVRLVPICFAVVDGFVVSAVDHKPKRTGQLRRLRDMTESGTATVLVDHYAEDWSTLWWVRIRGRATVHLTDEPEAVSAVDALVAKYAQYRDVRPAGEVFLLALDEVRWWSAAARGAS
jgi:PPOX class probable F420-dependent enzyme